MTLIVQTFFSFGGYCLRGKHCWEHVVLLNLFSRNILWRFYPKTGNLIQQKFLTVKIFGKKPMLTMKIKNKIFGVFASSDVQWSEKLLNFVQGIE